MTTFQHDRNPITAASIEADLRHLGVSQGMTLIVHSSLQSLGQWVIGGSVAVIHALQTVLGAEGTLIMPTQTGDLSDPAGWSNPPVPESWWPMVRESMPAYHPDMTPCLGMGVIPETFRCFPDVVRSAHPQVSFAAWGKHAEEITHHHALSDAFGNSSPLGRMYDLDAHILLIGVSYDNNTSLHLAECRAKLPDREPIKRGAPILVDGVRQWVTFYDIDTDTDDFNDLGADFERHIGLAVTGPIGFGSAKLIPMKPLVDYGVRWFESHRRKGSAAE